MCPWSSRAVLHLTPAIFTLRPQYAGDIRTTVILITRKPEDPQFGPHAEIKMAQVLGSPLHIWFICAYIPTHQTD